MFDDMRRLQEWSCPQWLQPLPSTSSELCPWTTRTWSWGWPLWYSSGSNLFFLLSDQRGTLRVRVLLWTWRPSRTELQLASLVGQGNRKLGLLNVPKMVELWLVSPFSGSIYVQVYARSLKLVDIGLEISTSSIEQENQSRKNKGLRLRQSSTILGPYEGLIYFYLGPPYLQWAWAALVCGKGISRCLVSKDAGIFFIMWTWVFSKNYSCLVWSITQNGLDFNHAKKSKCE